MSEKILFSLENCVKCTQTKKLIADRDDIEIVTFPHELGDWSEDQAEMAEKYDVYDDLQKTAPILWENENKHVGYLRIRKWLQENK
ncbi:MAG: hypothetical protein V5A64_05435 [Candidatus Thermoplasmatota archaeon]